jgi:chemotaxis response regulator CheB
VAGLRVVAVTMSPLLRDVVTTLLTDHVAVELVAAFDQRADSGRRLEDIDPNLILIGLRPGESDDIASDLLTRIPSAKVVAFSHDGRDVSVHEMRRHRQTLPDVSPQGVVEAILGGPAGWTN